ncbi:MAG: aldo/keto reductase [Anaerolineales bacterium]|nr:aldo/keto reductase [Anaerolineales bacterium]
MKRILGRSNLEVSALGMGCWAIGGPMRRTADGVTFEPMGWGQVDDAESIRAIHQAIDLGVTLFDTANNYGAGRSERVLGQALRGRRDQVVIATKFGSVFDEATRTHFDKGDDFVITPAFIREACEGSLRRLQTDVIDLYQFHWGNYDATRALTVRDTLEALVAEGKIRWYGWSTDRPELAAIFAAGAHCTAVQHRLNVLSDAPEMLALCAEEDLASINKQPLNAGLLTGKFTPETTFPEDDGRHGVDFSSERLRQRLQQIDDLRAVLTSGGRTMAQGALAWIWARSPRTIPIPGFKNTRQVAENAAAMSFGRLSAAEMRQVDEILGRGEVVAVG